MRSKTVLAFMIFMDTRSEEETASMQLRILFSYTYLYKKDKETIFFHAIARLLKKLT